ncbi:flagellar protein FlgN [Neobacillus sp. YX16]|uniref:flagellar protein FlgN n=1 Tax=Neobacillus sp. YX16 TaxID=3047874 RepID=UPI0024C33F8E|nr:flagellar protein FlgN [Neobacillus sp. YX16]WHZ05402.1 flagellar protein FlgN [Neobacillus sp. YX16]
MEDVKNLIDNLEEMIDAHKRMLDLAKEKRTLLVEGNSDGLKAVVYRESSCVDEIQKLEQQRKQLVQEYMVNKGLSGQSFSLEELSNIQGSPFVRTTLQSISKQLHVIIREITQLNESNQQLIQASLSYVQYSMGMLVKKEPAIGYGPNAKNRYSNMLDAKI